MITEFLIDEYGFKTKEHDRTYDCYANAECHHCSGVHDYMRYLKVGHGRATDDVGIDIRKGLLTRQQGIEIVKNYDDRTPKDMKVYLERIGMTEDEFYSIMESKRDPDFWKKDDSGKWIPADSVINHPGPKEEPNFAFERAENKVDGPDEGHLIM